MQWGGWVVVEWGGSLQVGQPCREYFIFLYIRLLSLKAGLQPVSCDTVCLVCGRQRASCACTLSACTRKHMLVVCVCVYRRTVM